MRSFRPVYCKSFSGKQISCFEKLVSGSRNFKLSPRFSDPRIVIDDRIFQSDSCLDDALEIEYQKTMDRLGYLALVKFENDQIKTVFLVQSSLWICETLDEFYKSNTTNENKNEFLISFVDKDNFGKQLLSRIFDLSRTCPISTILRAVADTIETLNLDGVEFAKLSRFFTAHVRWPNERIKSDIACLLIFCAGSACSEIQSQIHSVIFAKLLE